MSDFFERKSQAYEDQFQVTADPSIPPGTLPLTSTTHNNTLSTNADPSTVGMISVPYSWHESNLLAEEEKFNRSLKEKKKKTNKKEERRQAIEKTVLPNGQQFNTRSNRPEYSPVKLSSKASDFTLAAFVPPVEQRLDPSIQQTSLTPINLPPRVQVGMDNSNKKQPKFIQNDKLMNTNVSELYRRQKKTAAERRAVCLGCFGTVLCFVAAVIFVCIFLYAAVQPSPPQGH